MADAAMEATEFETSGPGAWEGCSDEELARAAQQGREGAWRVLYRRSQEHLLRYAEQLNHDEHTGEDLVQEALLRAWEKRHRYDPAYPWSHWVRAILRNLSCSRYRSEGGYRSLLQRAERGGSTSAVGLWHGSPPEGVEGAAVRAEQRARLEALLEELTDAERDVLVAWAEGDSVADIAREWEVNPSTLRGRLWRARNKLKSLYEGAVRAR